MNRLVRIYKLKSLTWSFVCFLNQAHSEINSEFTFWINFLVFFFFRHISIVYIYSHNSLNNVTWHVLYHRAKYVSKMFSCLSHSSLSWYYAIILIFMLESLYFYLKFYFYLFFLTVIHFVFHWIFHSNLLNIIKGQCPTRCPILSDDRPSRSRKLS